MLFFFFSSFLLSITGEVDELEVCGNHGVGGGFTITSEAWTGLVNRSSDITHDFIFVLSSRDVRRYTRSFPWLRATPLSHN